LLLTIKLNWISLSPVKIPSPWPKWNTGFDNSIGAIDMATKIKLLIIRALNSVDRFLNDLARIRAAAALARLGYHDQVRQLMIPENPVAGVNNQRRTKLNKSGVTETG
jgi:hypothetical protein